MRKMNKLIRARLGFGTGAALSSAGMLVLFGAGWALVVGGAAMAAGFLLLYDVDS